MDSEEVEVDDKPIMSTYQDSYLATMEEAVVPKLHDAPPESPLPQSVYFIRLYRNQKLYEAVLGLIVDGSSIKNAFGSIGIRPQMIQGWIAKGSRDSLQEKDSYYARFASDVFRAKSSSRAETETKARDSNPNKWLETDARGGRWVEEAEQLGMTAEEELEAIPEYTTEELEQARKETESELTGMIEAMEHVGAVDLDKEKWQKQKSDQS